MPSIETKREYMIEWLSTLGQHDGYTILIAVIRGCIVHADAPFQGTMGHYIQLQFGCN